MIMNESIRGDFVEMLYKNICLPIPDYNENMEDEPFQVIFIPRIMHVRYCISGAAI